MSIRAGMREGFGSYVPAPLMARLADRHPQLDILVAISGVLSLRFAPTACCSPAPGRRREALAGGTGAGVIAP